MFMNENRQKWVEETLRSIEGMQPQGPAEGFFERVTQRLHFHRQPKVKVAWVAGIAACFALLVAVNLVSLRKTTTSKPSQVENESGGIASEYSITAMDYNY